MKKVISLFSILMAVLILVSSIPVLACDDCNDYEEITIDDVYYIKDGGWVAEDYSGKSKHVEIASKINGIKVVGIDFSDSGWSKSAMNDLSVIKTLSIPASVKYAKISTLKNLKKVTIAKKNKHLKAEGKYILSKDGKTLHSVFYSVKYPKISNEITTIGGYAFTYSNVRKVVLGKNIKTIDAYAFKNCKRLKEVKFNKKLTKIVFGAFEECKKLKEVKLPNSVKKIGNSAFSGCSSIKSIKIPKKVKKIPRDCFSGCKNLEKVRFNNTTNIELGAFRGCGIKSINLKNIEELGEERKHSEIGSSFSQVFEMCKNLTSVKIGKKIQFIGESTFADCTKLESIKIPKNVRFIDYAAFKDCENLKDIYVYNPECEIYKYHSFHYPEAISSRVTIHGYKDSTAQKYAEENGNKFVELD